MANLLPALRGANAQRNLDLFRSYQDGTPLTEVARRFGLRPCTVWVICQQVSCRTGERLRPREPRKPQRDWTRMTGFGKPCRHCHQGVINRPRELCYRCYHTPGVRDLYPSTSKFAKRYAGLEPATMDELECYPDKRRPDHCRHEIPDGLCPQCEREQRAKITFREEANGQEDFGGPDRSHPGAFGSGMEG